MGNGEWGMGNGEWGMGNEKLYLIVMQSAVLTRKVKTSEIFKISEVLV
jgi:hypothetical protein